MSIVQLKKNIDCIIVGGGASGLICAGTAGSYGKNILIVEKNNILGKKLLITGKGRCNVTNNCDNNTLIANVCNNKKFLYSAFSQFSSSDTINFFTDLGVSLKTERGNRVFPSSDHSSDIVNALKIYIKKNNVQVLQGEVSDIITKDNIVSGVLLKSGEQISCSNIVLATGGKSYPITGSTGQGYEISKKHGHTVTELKPSLVPLELYEEDIYKMLQGLSLKNVSIKIIRNEKEIYSDFGEMLFTHFGISGPIVLSSSAYVKENDKTIIDLKPALSVEALDNRIINDFNKYQNKNFSNSLNDLLPMKMIPVVVSLSSIPQDEKVNSITKEQRLNLVNILKNFTLTIKALRPISEAIITSGGVNVSEVNPKTMESRIIKGLYFSGEILDVDAYTGGFNLQIAFSTGYLAGKSVGSGVN